MPTLKNLHDQSDLRRFLTDSSPTTLLLELSHEKMDTAEEGTE